MTESDTEQTDPVVKPRRIENARLVGHEYHVSLAFITEYELTVVAGHNDDDAVTVAEELALFGDDVKMSDRFLLHSDVEAIREIFEDDVEAGELNWVDEPSAPSEHTYWDDTKHFEPANGSQGDSE